MTVSHCLSGPVPLSETSLSLPQRSLPTGLLPKLICSLRVDGSRSTQQGIVKVTSVLLLLTTATSGLHFPLGAGREGPCFSFYKAFRHGLLLLRRLPRHGTSSEVQINLRGQMEGGKAVSSICIGEQGAGEEDSGLAAEGKEIYL